MMEIHHVLIPFPMRERLWQGEAPPPQKLVTPDTRRRDERPMPPRHPNDSAEQAMFSAKLRGLGEMMGLKDPPDSKQGSSVVRALVEAIFTGAAGSESSKLVGFESLFLVLVRNAGGPTGGTKHTRENSVSQYVRADLTNLKGTIRLKILIDQAEMERASAS